MDKYEFLRSIEQFDNRLEELSESLFNLDESFRKNMVSLSEYEKDRSHIREDIDFIESQRTEFKKKFSRPEYYRNNNYKSTQEPEHVTSYYNSSSVSEQVEYKKQSPGSIVILAILSFVFFKLTSIVSGFIATFIFGIITVSFMYLTVVTLIAVGKDA